MKTFNFLTKDGKYNYNAYLFADENNISIKVAKYEGTDKVDLIENHEYGYVDIITATNRVLDRTLVENTVKAKITAKKRIEKPLFDFKSFREAYINAMAHSRWDAGIGPTVEIYSDRITITSYGGLVSGITKEEMIEGCSVTRNQAIMRIFKDVDLVEQLGSGMKRIMKYYDESIFKITDNFMIVTFPFDTSEIKDIYTPGDYYDKQKENEKHTRNTQETHKKNAQESTILEYCIEARTIREITDYFGFKNVRNFREKYINPLIEKGLLEMTIPNQPTNRNQKYITKK